ncbi:MAG: hypothetical protein IJG64_01650 [Oscillospiraceae bacterium]|nr:hypothetical protein [Oscillospiraceae bacterium]
MYKNGFNYDRAIEDLYDAGNSYPEELLEYSDGKASSDKRRDNLLREWGLNPERYKDGTGKESSDDSCFLTTACVSSRGLADDCYELATLRRYRDTYLNDREGGNLDIDEYYSLAPQIVHAIDRLPDRDRIWSKVYEELISTCVRLIEEGKNEEAYRTYKRYTHRLWNTYCAN